MFLSDPRKPKQVRWHRPGRPAVTPRPMGDETLSSYCMRLAGVDGHSPLAYVRKMRVAPYLREFEDLETVGSNELIRHLAEFTGRSIESFHRLQFPHPTIRRIRYGDYLSPDYEKVAPLTIEARTSFCPHCWLERKCLHASYFSKSWAFPWILICPRHPNAGLLRDINLGNPPRWREECVDRSYWIASAKLTRPPWWSTVAEPIGLCDDTWPTFLDFARSYQHNGRYRAATGWSEATYVVARDIAMYCQFVRDTPAHLRALGAGGFSRNSCTLRGNVEITGTLIYRVNALAFAFAVMKWFGSGMREALPVPLRETIFEGNVSEHGAQTFVDRARYWPSIWKTKLRTCLPEGIREMLADCILAVEAP